MEDLNPNTTTVWLAYYHDHSGAAVFGNELACLRYALQHNMVVKHIALGVDLWEAPDLKSADSPSEGADRG